MWTSLALLAIVGFAAGAQSPWKANQEYTYDIYARTLTAIPDLKDQYVGVVTKGKLLLQTKGEGQLVGKLINIAHAHYHDQLAGGWNHQIDEHTLSFQQSELNNKQFILTTKNGVIQSIRVDGSMTNDEVNQLKAILSQLQVDIKGENLTKGKHNQLPESNDSPTALFKTMEATITGECETVYDIAPLPEYMVNHTHPRWAPRMPIRAEVRKGNFFQVMKTLNYDNCLVRKGYHFGITGESDVKPNTNQMGDFLSKSTVSKIVASGGVEDFTIQQVCTTNRIAVSPALYNEQKAQVISQVHMILAQIRDVQEKLEGPQQQSVSVGNLVYRYNLPSDKDNKIREGHSGGALGNFRNFASGSDENGGSDEFQGRRTRRYVSSEESQSQNRIRQGQDAAGSKSSSSESQEDMAAAPRNFQPRPDMQHAPETPLHPFTVGYKGRHIKHDSQVDLEREARRLAQEIGGDLQNQDEIPKRHTLGKFDVLVQVVRSMNLGEIEQVVAQMGAGRQENGDMSVILAWKTLRDAVAEAGTPPAVKVITKLILEGKIRGEEAAALLPAVVKRVQTPTLEVVKTLFALVKSEEVRKQKILHPTALIAFTDLVRRSEVDRKAAYSYYPVQAFGPFYKDLEQFTVQEVVPHIAQRLQQSVEQKNAQLILLYVRALGNTGHPDIIGVLEKYIEGADDFTHFQRTAAILALDKLTRTYPRVAKRVLYKTYANVALPPETRAAAVHLLIRADPSAAMLQRMAQYTHEDPSEAVQAIVKSAIESAAELTGKEWRHLAERAEAAKKFLNPRDYGRQYPKTYLKDYVAENLKTVYDQQLTHIVGRHHTHPESILYTVLQNYGGNYERNAEVEAMVSSVDDLISLIPGGKYTNEQERMEDGQQQQGSGQQWSTQHLEQLLNLKPEQREPVEGQVWVNLLGQKQFMTFDEKTLREIPTLLTAVSGALRNGHMMNKNKLYNRRSITVAFPLATGYPFVYTLTTPTLMQAIGKIQGQTTPDVTQSPSWATLDQIQSVNVTAQVHLVYSSEMSARAGFVAPFEHHEYVAAYVTKMQAHVPVKLAIDVDIKNRQIAGRIAPLEGKRSFDALYASAVPFTARKNLLHIAPITQAKDLRPIQSRPSERYERVIGEKTIGMAFRTEIRHQLPEQVQVELERALNEQGMLAMATLPYSYHATMRKIWNKHAFSSLSLVPFSYHPAAYAPSEKQIALTLATLPIADELTTKELIKAQGILSLLSLPFADIDTLQRTVQHIGAPSLAEQWPINALDAYKMRVQYDAQRSANEIIRFALNLEHAYNLDKNSPISSSSSNKMRASVDEQKLSYTNDVTPNSADRRKQFLENAAYEVRQASSIALDASLSFEGERPSEYVATIARAESPVDENERIVAFLSAKHAQSSSGKQMCLSYVGKFPNRPAFSFEEALRMDLKGEARLLAAFGENCMSGASQISASATLEQSAEYKEQLRTSVAGKVCAYEMSTGNNQMPACQEAIYRANILDDIRIAAEIENPTAAFRNVTRGALNVMRYIGFTALEENVNAKGQADRLEASIRIAPNLRHLTAAIQSEDMKLRARSLNILPPLRPFMQAHPQVDTHAEISAAGIRQIQRNGQMCVVDQNQILTLDGKTVSEKLGKCWHALVQYLAPQSAVVNEPRGFVQSQPVSVLARESSENGKKEVIIAVRQQGGPDHILHLKSKGSELQVTINGKEQSISQDRSIDVYDNSEHADRHQKAAIRLYQLSRQEVKVDIRDQKMELFFDGVRVKIQANPSYRGNLRGVCGNYNGEQVDDLAAPNNCVLANERLFVSSWALIGQGSCSQEVRELHAKADQSHCAPIAYGPGNVISRWEGGHRSGPLRKQTDKWSREWDSSSSASSSSSEEPQENYLRALPALPVRLRKPCAIVAQTQYVKIGDKTCFSLEELNACPAHCASGEKEQVKVKVHCRPTEDSKTQLFIQQIRKAILPHLGSRSDRTITFSVPKRCALKL